MHRRSDITICSISYLYNVRQQNNYLIYDFFLPMNNQQIRAFQVDFLQLSSLSKFENAFNSISQEQQKLLDKKRRAYNIVIPFKFSNAITKKLTELVMLNDQLTCSLNEEQFYKIISEQIHNGKQEINQESIVYLKQFIDLLCNEQIREVFILCESQEDLIKRYNLIYEQTEISLPNEIIPNKLHLGNSNHAFNLKNLRLLGITHIVNCAKEIPNYWSLEVSKEGHPQIQYFQVPILDLEEENISDHFDEAYIFINQALIKEKNKVLVHCAQGKSRSAAIIVMYLMRFYQWTYEEAIDYAKKRRDIIAINDGFQLQLQQL